jgi:hypothetical protein
MNRVAFAWVCATVAVVFMVCQNVAHALAFPGVVGFGRDTVGGRGGNIYQVTTNASAGTGSWAWALSQQGPRIIIFRTGGVIDTSQDIPANTTVFCQTAPGDGVAFDGSNIRINSNVIMRGCRLFPDNGKNGWTIRESQDVVIDHSSVAWAGNETFSSWQNSPYNTNPMARRVTISYNVFYEGLSGNCPGTGRWEGHGMQMAPTSETTIYRNAMINTTARNPQFSGPAWRVEVVNNIVFATTGGGKMDPTNSGVPGVKGQSLYHWVSNIYNSNQLNVIEEFENNSAVYTSDNIPAKNCCNLRNSNSPLFASLIPSSEIVSRGQLEAEILSDLGPIPRSSYLDRAISDYQAKRSRVQCPSDTPALSFSAGTPDQDTDGDGIPDAWEDANGLDKTDASDARGISTNGYMMIEEWANSLFGATPSPPDPPTTPPDPVPWFRISS